MTSNEDTKQNTNTQNINKKISKQANINSNDQVYPNAQIKLNKLPDTIKQNLQSTVKKIMRAGMGILAMDERPSTIGYRFSTLGIPNTPETRQDFRRLLTTAPGIEEFAGGVIMNEETLWQYSEEGIGLVEGLRKKGVVVGVKLDKGVVSMGSEIDPSECLSVGLEDMASRAARAKEAGVRFAKWRSVLSTAMLGPSSRSIEANVNVLSEFARRAQSSGLVPIVEPEIDFSGCAGLAEACEAAERVYSRLVKELKENGVYFPGLIFKISFVTIKGVSTDNALIACNAQVILKAFPAETGGVVFLSGGHPPAMVGELLNGVHSECKGKAGFPISFSFARAITGPVLEVWRGDKLKKDQAQQKLIGMLGYFKGAIE